MTTTDDALFANEITLNRFQTAPKVWNSNVVTGASTYPVSATNSAAIIAIGKKWFQELCSTPGMEFAHCTSWLACQLRSVNNPAKAHLLADTVTAALSNSVVNTIFQKLNTDNTYTSTPLPTTVTQTASLVGSIQPTQPLTLNDLFAPVSSPVSSSSTVPVNLNSPASQVPLPNSIPEVIEAAFYPYVAACLMRLGVKTKEGISTRWDRILENFAGIYSFSIEMKTAYTTTPSDLSLSILKSNLRTGTPLLTTFLSRALLARKKADDADKGLLDFCAVQFYYLSGMHLYSQFHDCCLTLMLKPIDFLKMIAFNIVYDSIKELIAVLIKYENSTKPEDEYWQYARSYGEAYFINIQTKHNTALTYLFADILFHFKGQQNDPRKIAALSSVSGALRTNLETISQAVISYVTPKLMINARADARLAQYLTPASGPINSANDLLGI